MSYTRPTDEGEVVMVEIRPHVFVRDDFARENGMSVLTRKREPKPKGGKKSRIETVHAD